MSLEGTKYWDDFGRRTEETIEALKNKTLPPLRRLSLHITNKCNLRCSYCNEAHKNKELPRPLFQKVLKEYSAVGGGILHITGGEPMCVSYLEEEIIRASKEYGNVNLHVNTNAIQPLSLDFILAVKRLKISMDSARSDYFDSLVGVKGAWNAAVKNLSKIDRLTEVYPEKAPVTSITYTMTKENYKQIPEFMRMFYTGMPRLYASFFSCYKGNDQRFAFDSESVEDLFTCVVPEMESLWEEFSDTESKFLFHASHDKKTFDEHERFPANKKQPCFLQLSELVIDEDGFASNCSHLFRDGVGKTEYNIADMSLQEVFTRCKEKYNLKPMHEKCVYGCNKKLVKFNSDVVESVNF